MSGTNVKPLEWKDDHYHGGEDYSPFDYSESLTPFGNILLVFHEGGYSPHNLPWGSSSNFIKDKSGKESIKKKVEEEYRRKILLCLGGQEEEP